MAETTGVRIRNMDDLDDVMARRRAVAAEPKAAPAAPAPVVNVEAPVVHVHTDSDAFSAAVNAMPSALATALAAAMAKAKNAPIKGLRMKVRERDHDGSIKVADFTIIRDA